MTRSPAAPTVAGLLLGGQLHNSSSSDLDHARAAYDTVAAMGGNAVTATVSWHLVEPEEGVFDFSGVDPLVDMARERGLALTLLWFGAYKNAASTYAPRWVRADAERFPRAGLGASSTGPGAFSRPGTPVLSVFSPALRAADRRAFEALTQHLAATGADGGPLVMLQVENETGLLGAGRDHSAVADAAWAGPVPAALTDWLAAHPGAQGTAARLWREHGSRTAGTWAELFGQDVWAEETFMAAGFAAYCGELAAAGAGRLDVTYYANAWLGPQPGQDLPGQYPSGGPVGGQVDVWRALAPAIAFLGPDIYVDDVKSALAPYLREDNEVVVPESRLAVGNLFWAVGSGAVGFNVFGVDDVRTDGQLAAGYRLLGGAGELIRAAQREGRVRPVLLEAGDSAVVELGALRWTLRGSMDVLRAMFLDAGVAVRTEAAEAPSESTGAALVASPADTRAMAVLVDLGGDELLAIGQGLMLDVEGADGSLVEIDDAWEGRYEDGQWVPGRNLNGDERLNLLPPDSLGAVRVRVLRRG
ncbi:MULTISPECIES: DUF5597 domain-containing protein [unclassified Actinomyces]|uniref:DUF5597 domain-containing protein n=1 Tax=unclassified Actinomyces TaxID=2609248 RepID=UPI0020170690|nr:MULTISPECIES: DUF5597 domain-containing protein [unclassified Actinomyces]MCL3777440.1 DUF5597 domain-containing protein [Actinomyces sp. AC-20-1]MCL3789743.1 DUF5597 domain-containing protein [Actinomyces sp. 187325]MCL3792119.1 DUF5597 domain-containing protein [Actinomyces sp. 186855]MCL3794797.1 DUF5597 domain-containing protein [Actinomyces sp. 217892]